MATEGLKPREVWAAQATAVPEYSESAARAVIITLEEAAVIMEGVQAVAEVAAAGHPIPPVSFS